MTMSLFVDLGCGDIRAGLFRIVFHCAVKSLKRRCTASDQGEGLGGRDTEGAGKFQCIEFGNEAGAAGADIDQAAALQQHRRHQIRRTRKIGKGAGNSRRAARLTVQQGGQNALVRPGIDPSRRVAYRFCLPPLHAITLALIRQTIPN